jgi:hypothetical protein
MPGMGGPWAAHSARRRLIGYGAYASSVERVDDFEKSTRENKVQARDRATNELLWAVDVYDPDPSAKVKQVKVKIASPVQPVLLEPLPGLPLAPVEFVGLVVRPYVGQNGRLAYSFAAEAVRAAGSCQAGRGDAAEQGLVSRLTGVEERCHERGRPD